MFLLPFALTIFGCSMLSGLSDRFSAGAAAGAVSSFLAFGGVFFFVSPGGAAVAAGASTLGTSLGASAAPAAGRTSFATFAAFGFLVASSAGLLVSAIKLFLLSRLCCG